MKERAKRIGETKLGNIEQAEWNVPRKLSLEGKMSKKLGRPYIDVHVTTFLHILFMYRQTRYNSHRKISPSFSLKPLGEISNFSPRNFAFRARGVSRWNARKELFPWADLYIKPLASLHR